MTAPILFREYIWLVETIYEAGKITLQELSEKWGLTEANYMHDLPVHSYESI